MSEHKNIKDLILELKNIKYESLSINADEPIKNIKFVKDKYNQTVESSSNIAPTKTKA